MKRKLEDYLDGPVSAQTTLELYNAALHLASDAVKEHGYNSGRKKLYYISAEFLIGKLLSNNLINLGLYDSVKKELADAGRSLSELEEFEAEPSLGNGGLGGWPPASWTAAPPSACLPTVSALPIMKVFSVRYLPTACRKKSPIPGWSGEEKTGCAGRNAAIRSTSAASPCLP
jgi:hypothetical protein